MRFVCDVCRFETVKEGSLGNHVKWEHGDPADRDSSDVYNPGVDDATLEGFKRIAGDGTTDERCARILAVFRDRWWGDPHQDTLKADPEPEPERHDPDVWWEAS